MAARKRKKRILSEEIAGIVLIALAILLGLSIYASESGAFGNALRRVCLGVFGSVAYVLPGLLFVLGVYFLIYAERKIPAGKAVCWALIALGFISILHLLYTQRMGGLAFKAYLDGSYELGINERIGGGALGALLAWPVYGLFGLVGAYIVNVAMILICALIATNLSFRSLHKDTSERIARIRVNSQQRRTRKVEQKQHRVIDRTGQGQTKGGLHVFTMRDDTGPSYDEDACELTFIPGLPNAREHIPQHFDQRPARNAPKPFILAEEQDEAQDAQGEAPAFSASSAPARQPKPRMGEQAVNEAKAETEQAVEQAKDQQQHAPYRIPPLSMLPHTPAQSARSVRNAQAEINANSALLERTFENFDIQARVINVSLGPSITRFEVQPAAGVRVNRITNLQDDLALALAASGVRIEAPIPGKSAIGIEVPNKQRLPVMLRELLEGENFRNSKGKLSVVLGKDITGLPKTRTSNCSAIRDGIMASHCWFWVGNPLCCIGGSFFQRVADHLTT
jgi:S-DNA-T family DNA segregation ATPase FtsK/SpoIIIE